MIHEIAFTIPNKWPSYGKIEQLLNNFPIPSELMLVDDEKKFPHHYLQVRIYPWTSKKYQYCVCLKSVGKILIPCNVIKENNCLIRFDEINEKYITATLFVDER